MRIVVKVGTSTLAYETGRMNIRRVECLCRVLSDLKNAGHEVIVVSSGAIGMGMGKLHLSRRPDDIPTKQAAAAVGQSELMDTYGPDSYIGRVAAVMLGSTETTFYVISVYFGAAGIHKTRYAIPAALLADLVGFIVSALTVRLFWA